MPKKTTDWLMAIGSTGTAVAAVIALVALFVAVQSSETERQRESAAEVRRNIMLISQESEILSRLLNDGSPIIVGSALIAEEFQSRLGPDPSAEEFWTQFDGGEPRMLSIALMGWQKSELSIRIDELRTSLRRLRILLTGDLLMLQYPVELYDAIIRDAYSPMIFTRILTDGKHLLLHSHRDEAMVSRITGQLAAELQSHTSLYYIARYERAVATVDEFVQLAVRSLVALDDETLLELSRSTGDSPDPARTRTESMRYFLERTKGRIPQSTYEQLQELTGRIEQYISKEEAREAIKDYSGNSK